MKAEQRFKQNFKALFFFLKTKIHELERRRVFYIILIIGIFRIDIFLPRKACGGMLLRAVILGSEASAGRHGGKMPAPQALKVFGGWGFCGEHPQRLFAYAQSDGVAGFPCIQNAGG